MIQIGYVLSGLIAAAILFLGARFWLAPATASAGFGIANSPPSSTGFAAWLSVKGTRDIAVGPFCHPAHDQWFAALARRIHARGEPHRIWRHGDSPPVGRKQSPRLRHAWPYRLGHRRNRRVPHLRRQVKTDLMT